MLRQFIWEAPAWPALTVDSGLLEQGMYDAAFDQGCVAGVLRALAKSDRSQVEIETLAGTAIDTSEIEGEHLSADGVRASLARRLAVEQPGHRGREDPRADGVVELTVDATRNASAPLTTERLWRWQTELFPSPPQSLTVGTWRTASDDPMQVVSGPVQRRSVHFEAPPARRVPAEMDSFLAWLNETSPKPTVITAAIAHLWFVTIHPFADGNGRIARAISDLVLARGQPEVSPYVSLSRQIRKQKLSYYRALEKAQRGSTDVTEWVSWFIDCYRVAVADTIGAVDEIVLTAAFWRDHREVDFNARQRRVLERYLAGGFEGWLNSGKYAAIANTSADTAQRDLTDLVKKGIIVANPGRGRRTSYRLPSSLARGPDDEAGTLTEGP
jgi:Fic family protein